MDKKVKKAVAPSLNRSLFFCSVVVFLQNSQKIFTRSLNSEHFKLECFCADFNGAFEKCQEGKQTNKNKTLRVSGEPSLNERKTSRAVRFIWEVIVPEWQKQTKTDFFPRRDENPERGSRGFRVNEMET